MTYNKILLWLLLSSGIALFSSCTKLEIKGCNDPSAKNYDPSATSNNGTCLYDVSGCTNPAANNYNPAANIDDGSCTFDPPGQVVFWKYAANYYDKITVQLSGQSRVVTGNVTSFDNLPNCDDCSYCANFTLPPGTYYFDAVETGGGETWTQEKIVITSGGCLVYRLRK